MRQSPSPPSPRSPARWISARACVDNLLHAASIDTAALGARRVVQMPALHLSMTDVIAALVELHGPDRTSLVSHDPQDMVVRLFASYPALHTPRAEARGFTHDGSARALARHATEV